MIKVGLSSASVWPEPAEAAFSIAADLGYDGVEIMVWADTASQDVGTLRKYADRYDMPILAIHAPCLLISQRVWSPDPEVRLRRSVEAASDLDAPTVVIHPPFRWQRRYADGFSDLVSSLERRSGITIAVENMFPMRSNGMRITGGRSVEVSAFRPSPDPTDVGFAHYTLDLSHTAAAGMDALELAKRMGNGLAHIHLADGTGVPRDEHLVPGKGTQPCAALCHGLARGSFSGAVVLEVSTRKARGRRDRVEVLTESLQFARKHL